MVHKVLQGVWVRGVVLSTALALVGVGVGTVPASAGAATDGCTIVGTNGPDVLQGTPADDIICGRNGDDLLLGGGGDDVLDGGNGADRLDGGAGADTLRGGTGSDTLLGTEGADVLDGENGDDLLQGGPEGDALFGGNGRDTLAGDTGDDTLDGGNGPDTCDGGTGTMPTRFVDCESTTEELTAEPEDPAADTDADGLPAALEAILGSSTRTSDTDGDGLTDTEEFDTSTDPLVTDSDSNGILDGADDTDGDTLTNRAELDAGSDPARSDTDGDGVVDGAETAAGTSLTNGDSDADNLDDLQEHQLGTDPLRPDTDGDGTGDALDRHDQTITDTGTGASLTLTGLAPAVLAVDLAPSGDTRLLEVPGAVSAPVEVRGADGVRGTLTIPFDLALVAPGADVAVLHFDEETELFDRPADQSIDLARGVATVTTDDFSPFVVVDLDEFADVFADQIWTLGQVNDEPIDFGLLLDLSVTREDDPVMWARHRAASHAVVDALRPGDRVMLHSYPWMNSVAEFTVDPSTDRFRFSEDFEAVHDAIDEAYETTWGSTYPLMGEQLTRLIDELDVATDDGRATSIVAFGDGGGWTYPYRGMPTAIAHGVPISVVAFEPLYIEEQVQAIADDSGGVLVKIDDGKDPAAQVRGLLGTAAARPLSDRDGDRLPDVTERKGMPTSTGKTYRTNPNDADTDDDGLPDGDEMRAVTSVYGLVPGSTFKPQADPTDPDSDNDGLNDWYEVANITQAFEADRDWDGLDDRAELLDHHVEPMHADTDLDGFTDGWEVDHAAQGFDADVFDVRYEWWEYAGDFSRGTLCGDADFWEFCQSDSVAFLAGSLAAGFVGVGDIRDTLAGIAKGDPIASGLAFASIVPYIGDASSVVRKLAKHLNPGSSTAPVMRSMSITPTAAGTPTGSVVPPGSTLRDIGKADYIPAALRIQALDLAFGGAATALKNRGVDEKTVLAYARRGMSPTHVTAMLDGARRLQTGAGRFSSEIDAENVLRATLPNARPDRPGIALQAGGPLNKRYPDILDPSSGIGYEVKFGKVKASGRATRQALADQNAVALGDDGTVGQMEWHFFADADGVAGPDEDLLALLQQTGRPYVIHLP